MYYCFLWEMGNKALQCPYWSQVNSLKVTSLLIQEFFRSRHKTSEIIISITDQTQVVILDHIL